MPGGQPRANQGRRSILARAGRLPDELRGLAHLAAGTGTRPGPIPGFVPASLSSSFLILPLYPYLTRGTPWTDVRAEPCFSSDAVGHLVVASSRHR